MKDRGHNRRKVWGRFQAVWISMGVLAIVILIVWCVRVSRGPLLPVQAQAQARTGGPVQVRVQVGKAPAEGSAPGAPAAEHDNLDDLLALGRQFDNIIIKE